MSADRVTRPERISFAELKTAIAMAAIRSCGTSIIAVEDAASEAHCVCSFRPIPREEAMIGLFESYVVTLNSPILILILILIMKTDHS